jgi:hypothetical protein
MHSGLLQLSMTASSCYPALCDNDNLAKAAKGKEGVRRNHVMEKMLIQIRIKKKRKALKKNHLTQHYSMLQKQHVFCKKNVNIEWRPLEKKYRSFSVFSVNCEQILT